LAFVWETVLKGSLVGLGRGKLVFWIAAPLTIARVPVAYLLAVTLALGVDGVWWAIALTTIAKAVVLGVVCRRVLGSAFVAASLTTPVGETPPRSDAPS